MNEEKNTEMQQTARARQYVRVLECLGATVMLYDAKSETYAVTLRTNDLERAGIPARFTARELVRIGAVSEADAGEITEAVTRVAAGKSGSAESVVQFRVRGGERRWFHVHMLSGEDIPKGQALLAVSDINDQAEADAALHTRAERDELTGLYNRAAFLEKAAEMIDAQDAGHYVMACFDVDKFRLINDRYGSAKGDEVLRFLANTFQEGFGGTAACCRVNADRFAVLYPAYFSETKEIEEIRARAMLLDGSIPPIAFSVGRYLVDDKSLPVSAMFDRATMAEASVKDRFDKSVAWFDESMRVRQIEEQRIRDEMQSALEKGQFEVYLQPQFNHATGAIIGAEALVRWNHPTRGLLLPGEFLPVFERGGFIYEMDKYVWERVCELLRKWLDEGNAVPVSVNVSGYDVSRESFFEDFTGLVARYGIPEDMLRIEITESAFALAAAPIAALVKRLCDHGFLVEIDDFGGGSSSLNTLKDVAASVIKLDMHFLEDTGHSQRGGNILESIIRMANWLDVPVIAEGVETKEQADYLKTIGCAYMQGFWYARPMPIEDFEAFAKRASIERDMMGLETAGALDNDAFWDPNSMETLIFNSYVDGACVFEYFDGRMEMLRVNENYAKTVLGENGTVRDVLNLAITDYMDEDGVARMRESVLRAAETGEDFVYEIELHGLRQDEPVQFLRMSARRIASAGERVLLYATAIDVTAQRLAEQQNRDTGEQIRFLNDLARDLMSHDDIDEGVGVTLRKVLEHFGAARAYVFEFHSGEGMAENTYELCAKGVPPQRRENKRVDMRAFPYWLNSFAKKRAVIVQDAAALQEDRREERAFLEAQSIHAITVVPFFNGERVAGFIGVDDPAKNGAQVQSLMALGDYIAVMLLRRAMIARIRNDNRALDTLVNDMPGGFARLAVHEGGALTAEYVNRAFCEMLGFTNEELMRHYAENALWNVHAADANILRDAVAQLRHTKDMRCISYRLKNAAGEYLWYTVFGRMTQDEDGKDFLNTYYLDVAERERADELRRELLDSMPCAAGIYNFSRDDMLRTLYVNKRYKDMVSEEGADLTSATAMDVVHPEDRERLLRALRLSESENCPLDIDVRLYHKSGEFRYFHVSGAITGQLQRASSLFVTFTPLTTEELAYREMLPVALAAMLDASEDFTFIKDKDYRYLGCSRPFARITGHDDPKEIVGLTDWDLFEKSLADKYHADDMRLMEGGESMVNALESLPDVEGIPHYSSTSKFLLRDSFGGAIGIYGFGRDVTQVRADYAKLKLLTDNIPGGLAMYALTKDDASLLYGSDGIGLITGYTEAEFTRLSRENVLFPVYPEDIPLLNEIRDKAFAGERFAVSFRIRTATGDERWLDLRGVPGDRVGDSLMLNLVMFDVTEQRLLQRRFYNVIHTVPCGICLFRWDGEALEPVLVNAQFSEMLGQDALPYLQQAKTFNYSHVHPGDLPGLVEELKRMLETTHGMDYTYRTLNAKENKYRWVHMRGTGVTQADGTLLVYASYTDETAARKTEQQLRENERAVSIATEAIYLRYWRYDVRTDQAFFGMDRYNDFKFPPIVDKWVDTWIGTGAMPPEYEGVYREMFRKIRLGERQSGCDVRMRWADGITHWVRLRLSNLYDETGAYIITVCACYFIDLEKDMEAKYQLERTKPSMGEKDLLIRSLYNVTTGETIETVYPDGTVVAPEDRLVFAENKRNADNLLIDREERRAFHAFNDRRKLLAAFARGETTQSLDVRRKIRGEVIWVRNIMQMIRDPKGTDVLAFVYVYDVEEEKMQTLTYRSLATENYDYVARVNGRTKRFVSFPKAGLTGSVPPRQGNNADDVARNLNGRIYAEDRQAAFSRLLVDNTLLNLKKSGRVQFVYRIMEQDGVLHYKKITQYYIDRQREIYVMVREDVTALLQAETAKNALLADALDAAKQASEAKSQFLSRMSHELRTPMNAIIGLSALAESDVSDPNAMADAIGKISGSARYLLSLINDILEMSRIESGRTALNEAPFDMDALLGAVGAIIGGQAHEKGVSYELDRDGSVSSFYVGDATKVQQVLVNILGNAVKFTPQGGSVRLAARQVSEANGRASLRFSAVDTGSGIDKSFMPHLFDSFSQESASFISTSTGTGLGLAITKNLVEMMGGTIDVQSEKGKGSTFVIDVQLGVYVNPAQTAKRDAPDEKRGHFDFTGREILLAEDHPLNIEVAKRLLEKRGATVTVAHDGSEAVRLFAASHPGFFDAILMDIRMPVMDGLTAAKTIRNLRRADGQSVPIIAMTANAFDEDVEISLKSGMNAHVSKPIDPIVMFETIERFMASRPIE